MKPEPAGAELLINTRPMVRALISPVRQEIVDALESIGPSTIAVLAARMGRPADGLYFHLRRLERVGIVVRRESVRSGRHVAAVFDLARRPTRVVLGPPVRHEDMAALSATMLRLAARDTARALRSASAPMHGLERRIWFARLRGWLTDAEVQRINKHLSAALRIIRNGRPRKGASPMALTISSAPAAARRAPAEPSDAAPRVQPAKPRATRARRKAKGT
jgi:DNA-binding transcriptional ArsR family regulator